jgi:hypothetical protein
MKTNDQKYIDTCKKLGFSADIHFVEITKSGSIGFSMGKPEEIRALARACDREGMTKSRGLISALKRA